MANEYKYEHHPKSNQFGTIRIGSGSSYTDFEADGTMVAQGDATVWCDWKFSATALRQGALSKPDYDYTNKGLLFPQNDETETVSFGEIIDHSWKLGSTFYPHLHYIQDEVAIPEFTLEYRVYDAGAAVPGWTTITTTGTPVFSYTSGSIHQILEFPAIPMPAVGLAALFEGTLYRSTGDGVTGDVLVKEFDIHIEMDTIGSRQVFTK